MKFALSPAMSPHQSGSASSRLDYEQTGSQLLLQGDYANYGPDRPVWVNECNGDIPPATRHIVSGLPTPRTGLFSLRVIAIVAMRTQVYRKIWDHLGSRKVQASRTATA